MFCADSALSVLEQDNLSKYMPFLAFSGRDPKCRGEKDDGFVRVTFKTEKGKQHK